MEKKSSSKIVMKGLLGSRGKLYRGLDEATIQVNQNKRFISVRNPFAVYLFIILCPLLLFSNNISHVIP